MEWVKIELDFPKRVIRVELSRPVADRYPALSSSFPALAMAIEHFENGQVAEGMMVLAWDMERLLDNLAAADSAVGPARSELPPRRASLGQKMRDALEATGAAALRPDLDTFVGARNQAAHGHRPRESSMPWEATLIAAERLVAHLISAKIGG